MKQKIIKKRIIAILSSILITLSFPIIVMADESSVSYDESSQQTGITSEDWEELQSEVQAELNSQNAEQSNNIASSSDKNNGDKDDTFKDFKEGKYVGSGEWLLVIGIILILIGFAGIGFIVFMMVRRKKLLKAKSMSNRRKRHPALNNRTSNQNNNGSSSGRRIAPKNNRDR